MLNYFYNVKRHLKFDHKEIREIILMVLLVTFVLGYDDGYDIFIMKRWLFNLFNSFVIATSVIFAKELGHKLMAIKKGYTAKTNVNWYMFGIIAVIAFLSRGKLHILLPMTGLTIIHNPRMKLGSFRYGHNYFDNAVIAFGGALASIYLAFIFKVFSFMPNPLILEAMQMNIIYGLLTFLPLDLIFTLFYTPRYLEKADLRKHAPPFPGTFIFYGSRYYFLFGISAMLILSALMFTGGIIVTSVIAIIAGVFVALFEGFRKEFTSG